MVHASRFAGAALGVCLLALASSCSDTTPIAPSTEQQPNLKAPAARIGPRQHVIVLKEGVTTDLRAAVAKAGGKVKRFHPEIGTMSVEGLSDVAVALLKQLPAVEDINLDVKTRWIPPLRQQMRRVSGPRAGVRSDQSGATFFDVWQWNLKVIRADDAWTRTKQGADALVCVLDTGIDPTHQELVGKVNLGVSTSFIEGESAVQDFHGHGTFVAALISSNGIDMASVAPDAELCAIKAFDKDGSATDADVIAAILYAGQIGADVANMSFGDYFSRKDEGAKARIRALQRAVNFASRKGVLLVAAAGNEAINFNTDPKDFIDVPAELDHVVSVGATAPVGQSNFDRIASYSNFGNSGVDLFAPGGDFTEGSVIEDLILSACSPSADFFGCTPADYLIGAGTSFAAPHVSGAGAVIESQLRGNQDDQKLTNCILKSADPVTGRRNDPLYGHGRLNVLRGAEC